MEQSISYNFRLVKFYFTMEKIFTTFFLTSALNYDIYTTMNLRPYQSELKQKVYSGWNEGHTNVLAVAPTGSGKTVTFSDILRDTKGASAAIAHRQELVGQISLALAKDGVIHKIIGPESVIREAVSTQMEEVGKSFYNPNAACAVAGIDTLVSWAKEDSKHSGQLASWAPQVRLWIMDEAHHLLRKNKWGKGIQLFPNAKGLGVTAIPERADGHGLGRHADGVFDTLCVGPGMRELINAGYLTDYRIICPPTNLDLSKVSTGVDGDFIRKQLALQTKGSSVMGDVVEYYLKFAAGKLGVTFAPDVETASELAVRYLAAGVPAEVVSAKTPGNLRRELIRRFRRKEILQLVNVDLFGEGFDLPAIEVVSMARATQSYSLFGQQFGRALRILPGKQKAIILDHVGNVLRHGGPPDRPRVWSLDRKEKRSGVKKDEGLIPYRNCLNPECMAPFERIYPACPFCGWVPTPSGRSSVEFVDGDLFELDEATLRVLRGEVERTDEHPDVVRRRMQHAGHDYVVAKGAANRHAEKLEAQERLRTSIAWWAGTKRAQGQPDNVSYREFYLTYGVDVLTAQTLSRQDAETLAQRIDNSIGRQ